MEVGPPPSPQGSALDTLLERFADACLAVFGADGVECILLHGSAAKGGAIPGFSDIDFQVFLAPGCLDSKGNLPDQLAFEVQERLGSLPFGELGFLYHQVYFLDSTRYPSDWAGPVPGGYRVLWGSLPEGLAATPERLRESSLRYLTRELAPLIDRDVQDFADAPDHTLPRRLRLLSTRLTPALYALAAHDDPDPIAVWIETKDRALERLRARYPDAPGPDLAARFFANVRTLFGREWDVKLARETFRLGIGFLRWAEAQGRKAGPPP